MALSDLWHHIRRFGARAGASPRELCEPGAAAGRSAADVPFPGIDDARVLLRGKYINDVFYTGRLGGRACVVKCTTKCRWSVGNEFRLARRVHAIAPDVVEEPLSTGDDLHGMAYVATARIAGPSLADLLAKGLSDAQADAFAADVLRLAGALKASGVVHRDLFEDNLLLDSDGHLKAIDFQLAIDRADYREDPWVARHWKFRYVVFGVNRDLGLGVWNDFAALGRILGRFPQTDAVKSAAARLAAEAPAILYYGYGGLFFTNEKKTPFLPNIVFAWRYFVSNEATREMDVRRNPALGPITRVVGYAKMDRLAGLVETARGGEALPGRRKRVVLSPHHSIDRAADGLALSTFLKNHGMYLKLPAMFPEIDFVFRPHPLLFARLETPKWWGRERTDAYRAKISSFPNVEFQQGGDYFETFARSDALVHDCGSFLAEYFYTGRPQCYLLGGDETVERQFLPFSRRLLAHAHRAYREEDVFDFIRRVVVAGDDPGRAWRDAFAAREVCVNHPHAADGVVNAVLETLAR